MKTKFTTLLIALMISQSSFCQSFISINQKESFAVSTSIDFGASFKEKGLDIVGEIEYIGPIYAKVGFESFQALEGGYTDFHGAIGINLRANPNLTIYEKVRMFAGLRSAMVFRNGGYMWNPGLEAGTHVDVTKNIYIGVRITLDIRNDQEIMGWPVENKFSFFGTLGYKWDFKGY